MYPSLSKLSEELKDPATFYIANKKKPEICEAATVVLTSRCVDDEYASSASSWVSFKAAITRLNIA